MECVKRELETVNAWQIKRLKPMNDFWLTVYFKDGQETLISTLYAEVEDIKVGYWLVRLPIGGFNYQWIDNAAFKAKYKVKRGKIDEM